MSYELSRKKMRELWRQAVHNKTHDLLHAAQDLRGAFESLAPEGWMAHDKFCLFERQLALVRSEIARLVSQAGRICRIYDEPPEEKE